jgi:hypothetical protein
MLNEIDTTAYSNENKLDLATTWSWLARRSLLEPDIVKARKAVKDCKPDKLYFKNYKYELYEILLELTPKSSDSFLRRFTQTMNKYVELKPHLFGIGLNVNAMLEDMDAAGHKEHPPKT